MPATAELTTLVSLASTLVLRVRQKGPVQLCSFSLHSEPELNTQILNAESTKDSSRYMYTKTVKSFGCIREYINAVMCCDAFKTSYLSI